jgi:hypothetical protein
MGKHLKPNLMRSIFGEQLKSSDALQELEAIESLDRATHQSQSLGKGLGVVIVAGHSFGASGAQLMPLPYTAWLLVGSGVE